MRQRSRLNAPTQTLKVDHPGNSNPLPRPTPAAQPSRPDPPRLEWRNFGEPVARAEGRAFLRHSCSGCRDREVTRPRVSVKLNQLSPNGPALTYHHISYTLHGSRRRGFPRHGSQTLE